MPKPTPEDLDRSIALAGELALAWCREQIEAVATIFPLGDGSNPFRNGFATACDEMEERLTTIRFDAILEATVTAIRGEQFS